MLLPDINVWLALAFAGHKHHQSAQVWLETAVEHTLFFCRLTQQGFLRLASSKAIVGAEVVSLRDAWKAYDTIFADPRVEFASEPPGIEPVWRSYTQSESFSPKVWNDAYLAAFARISGFEVITFDQGFKVYDDVKRTILQ
ncbi:MAG: PIN domain-containing protein [Planctomycetia bacterium]|nr:PIN domain-containing protein [Planctomycetia bacterium]